MFFAISQICSKLCMHVERTTQIDSQSQVHKLRETQYIRIQMCVVFGGKICYF